MSSRLPKRPVEDDWYLRTWTNRDWDGSIMTEEPLKDMSMDRLLELFGRMERRLILLEKNGRHNLRKRRYVAGGWLTLFNEEIARRA